MADATVQNPTIRADEAAHFGKLAAEWWDPHGSSAMLHKLNPVRLRYIRAAINAHWGIDDRKFNPLEGKSALDVGCGAGLLCEPLARLGAGVTGVDAAVENIAAACAHADGSGLAIRYMPGEIAAQDIGTFDLVTSMEVLEHVADKPAFIRALAARLADGGLMILSTPNRTTQSRLLLVKGAEAIGAVPKGTHHWEDFVTPEELRALLAAEGLVMSEPTGIGYSPLKGFTLSGDLALDYIVTVTAQG